MFLTSGHSTNVMQFEDSQTWCILIPYNQTKWTETTWKAFEEVISRGRNRLSRPNTWWMMDDDDDDDDDDDQ